MKFETVVKVLSTQSSSLRVKDEVLNQAANRIWRVENVAKTDNAVVLRP